MCSLEEAWGQDYKTKYGSSESNVYFSNSGIHEDYNTTPDNLLNPDANLPAPAVSKTVRTAANRRLSSVDCKKEPKLIKPSYNNIPDGLSSCRVPMYHLDNSNLEANTIYTNRQNNERFESTSQSNSRMQNNDTHHNVDNDNSVVIYQQHQEILQMLNALNEKLEYLQNNMNSQSTRNTHDIILYVLVGMMISMVIYLIINKLQ